MASFKRIDRQQVYSLEVYDGRETKTEPFAVGDVISRNPNSKAILKVADESAAVTAKSNGLELYIIAQSDAVTNKSGTAYKTYRLNRELAVSDSSSALSLIAAYRVDNIDNVNF